MHDFENIISRDNEILPGGLLPPVHGSSLRSSINRLAARSSMNSGRANSVLDPHALEEAALARRGVLLARVVQAVNLHTLGYSASKLDKDKRGASSGNLPSYTIGDSRGQNSRSSRNSSAFKRQNNLALACGGGAFRVCLSLPDGGVGGCGDACASPWRQAVDNHEPLSSSSMVARHDRRRQTGKSSEASESFHAAAHVLWNAEGHLLVPEYYGESAVQVAVVWCPPRDSSSSCLAPSCTCSGGNSSVSGGINSSCTCRSSGGNQTTCGSTSEAAAARAAVHGFAAAAASERTWRGEVVVGTASFKLSDAVVKRCPPPACPQPSPLADPSVSNQEASKGPNFSSNSAPGYAAAAAAAAGSLHAQDGRSSGTDINDDVASNNANAVGSKLATPRSSTTQSTTSSSTTVSERPFTQWAQGVAAFALEASGHHSKNNDAFSDPALAKASSSSGAHSSAQQRTNTAPGERTPPTPSSTLSSALPLPRLPSPVLILGGTSTSASKTSKRQASLGAGSLTESSKIRPNERPIHLATRKEAEALALEKFGVLQWQSSKKASIDDNKQNDTSGDEEISDEDNIDHDNTANDFAQQAAHDEDEVEAENDDEFIGPPLLPWEGPDTYVVDLWVPIKSAGIDSEEAGTAGFKASKIATAAAAVRVQLRYAPLAAAVGRWPHPAEAARSEETAAKAWYQRTQRSSLRQKKDAAAAAASHLRANPQQNLSSSALASSNKSSNASSTYPPLPPFRSWNNSGHISSSSSGSSGSLSSSISCSSNSGNSNGLDGGRSELHMASALGLDQHLAALLSALGTCPAVGPSRRRGLVARALALRASAPPPPPPSLKKQPMNKKQQPSSSRSTTNKFANSLPAPISQAASSPVYDGTAVALGGEFTLEESQSKPTSFGTLPTGDAAALLPTISDQAEGKTTEGKSKEGKGEKEASENNEGEARGRSQSIDHDQQSEAMGSLFRGSWPPVAVKNTSDPTEYELGDAVEVAAAVDYEAVEIDKEVREVKSNLHVDSSTTLPHDSSQSLATGAASAAAAAEASVSVDHETSRSSLDDGTHKRLEIPELAEIRPDETLTPTTAAKTVQPWASPRRKISADLPQADAAEPVEMPIETTGHVAPLGETSEKASETTGATLPVVATSETVEGASEQANPPRNGGTSAANQEEVIRQEQVDEEEEDEDNESGSFDSLVESSDNTDDSSSDQKVDDVDEEEEKEERDEKGETKDGEVEVEGRDSEDWRNEAFRRYFAVNVFDNEGTSGGTKLDSSKTSSGSGSWKGGVRHSHHEKKFEEKMEPERSSGRAWRSRDSDGLTALGFAIRGGAGFVTWRPPRSAKSLSPAVPTSHSKASAQLTISPQVIERGATNHNSGDGPVSDSSSAVFSGGSSNVIDGSREVRASINDRTDGSSEDSSSEDNSTNTIALWRAQGRLPLKPRPAPPPCWWSFFWPLLPSDCFGRNRSSSQGPQGSTTRDNSGNGSNIDLCDGSGGSGRRKQYSLRSQPWYPNASERCIRLLVAGDPLYRPDGSRPNLPRKRSCGSCSAVDRNGSAAAASNPASSTSLSSNSTSCSRNLSSAFATHKWSNSWNACFESILLAHFGDNVDSGLDNTSSNNRRSRGGDGSSLRFNFGADVGEATLWRERSFAPSSTSSLNGVSESNYPEARRLPENASTGLFSTADSISQASTSASSSFVYASDVAADDHRDALEARRFHVGSDDNLDSSLELNSSRFSSLLLRAGEKSQEKSREFAPPSPPQALHLAIAAGRPELLSACLESFASAHPSNAAATPDLTLRKSRVEGRRGSIYRGRASTVEGPLSRSLETETAILQDMDHIDNENGNDIDHTNDENSAAAAAASGAADNDNDNGYHDEMNAWVKSVCAVEASLLEARDPCTGLTPLLHACALVVISAAKERQTLAALRMLQQSSIAENAATIAEKVSSIAENADDSADLQSKSSKVLKVASSVEEAREANIVRDPTSSSPMRQQLLRDPAKVKARQQLRIQRLERKHHAVKEEGISARVCAELLLEAGADLGAMNAQGDTALMLACRSGDIHLVQCILAAGAEAARATASGATSDQTERTNTGDSALATNEPNANQGATGTSARRRNNQQQSSWWPRWPTAEERRAARAAALAQQEEQEMQAAIAAVAAVERADAEAAVAAAIAAEAAAAESTTSGAEVSAGSTTSAEDPATHSHNDEGVSSTATFHPSSTSSADTIASGSAADSAVAVNAVDSAANATSSALAPAPVAPASVVSTVAPATALATEIEPAAAATAATTAENSVEVTSTEQGQVEEPGPRATLPPPSHLRGHSALPWHRNLQGEDALSCACSGGHLHVVRLLVEGLHVWPDILQQESELEKKREEAEGLGVARKNRDASGGGGGGRSLALVPWPSAPLSSASLAASPSSRASMGVPASSRSAQSGRTALHHAAAAGEVEVCAMLLCYWAQSPQGALLGMRQISTTTLAASSSTSVSTVKVFDKNGPATMVEVATGAEAIGKAGTADEVDDEKKTNLGAITGTEMTATRRSLHSTSHSAPIAPDAMRRVRWCRGLEHGAPTCLDAEGNSAASLARRNGFSALGDAIDSAVSDARQAAATAASNSAIEGATAATTGNPSVPSCMSSRLVKNNAALAAAATAAVQTSFARLLYSQGNRIESSSSKSLLGATADSGSSCGVSDGDFDSWHNSSYRVSDEVTEDRIGDSENDGATWAEDPDYTYVWPDDE